MDKEEDNDDTFPVESLANALKEYIPSLSADDVIEKIISNFTNKEEGVRNLKRCIETIVSKINIYNLSYNEKEDKEDIDLTFEIKDFKLPLTITSDIIDILLKNKSPDGPPSHMYM